MLQSDSVFSQNLTVLYKCSEVVLLRSSQEILCVLLVDVSTSSEGLADRNLRLLCSHAINDIQDASVGLGLQVIRTKQREGMEKTDSTGGGGARQFTGPVMKVTTLDRGFANSTTDEVVKLTQHARAITDVEDEELRAAATGDR
ncbi:hypothetical protein YC2023_041548 [Brassica napus]